MADEDVKRDLLTTAEAAQYLRKSVGAMRTWRLKGGGPGHIKLSERSYLYDRQELVDFLNSHRS